VSTDISILSSHHDMSPRDVESRAIIIVFFVVLDHVDTLVVYSPH